MYLEAVLHRDLGTLLHLHLSALLAGHGAAVLAVHLSAVLPRYGDALLPLHLHRHTLAHLLGLRPALLLHSGPTLLVRHFLAGWRWAGPADLSSDLFAAVEHRNRHRSGLGGGGGVVMVAGGWRYDCRSGGVLGTKWLVVCD